MGFGMRCYLRCVGFRVRCLGSCWLVDLILFGCFW